MKRRYRILLFALALAVPGTVAWQAVRRGEPVYQGRPESAWISSLTNSYAIERDVQEWQTLGADAVPFLLRVVERREGAIHAGYVKVWAKLPGPVQRWCPRPVARAWPRTHALNVLSELAKRTPVPAGPLVWALRDSDPKIRMAAASCLISLTSTASPGKERQEVARALIQAFHNNTNSAPGWSPEAGVRNNVVIALGQCGDQAKIVVPVLLQALQDPDKNVRSVATNALKRIDPTAAASAGVN